MCPIVVLFLIAASIFVSGCASTEKTSSVNVDTKDSANSTGEVLASVDNDYSKGLYNYNLTKPFNESESAEKSYRIGVSGAVGSINVSDKEVAKYEMNIKIFNYGDKEIDNSTIFVLFHAGNNSANVSWEGQNLETITPGSSVEYKFFIISDIIDLARPGEILWCDVYVLQKMPKGATTELISALGGELPTNADVFETEKTKEVLFSIPNPLN